MTPKEKALELVDKYIRYTPVEYEYEYAKQCALIAVEELIKCTPSVNGRPPNYQTENEYCCEYWGSVKAELEKL